jgi:adenylate cyclase
VIGLDVILDRKRLDSDDQRLANAIDHAGNVILVSEYGFGNLGRNEPLPEFEATAGGVGFGDLPLDEDGTVRRMRLMLNQPNYQRVSFPVALGVYATDQTLKPGGTGYLRFGSTFIPLATRDPASAWIDFHVGFPVRSIPVTELLEDRFDRQILNDKIVLIGQSSEMGRDLFTTPAFHFRSPAQGRNQLSGAEIHAAALATLLDGRFPRRMAALPEWGINFVLALLSILITIRVRWVLLVVYFLAATMGISVLALLLFSHLRLWMPYLATEACVVLACPAAFGYRYLEERAAKRRTEAERHQLMGLFERYVSADVAAEIWKRRDQLVLAGEERVATVLFSDIRSFTALTAGKPSAQVLEWLNRYLTAMSEVVKANHGFLNKFIGDGIMVIFGVPLGESEREDAHRSVHCALQMLEEVDKLNAQMDAAKPRLKIGIGIHTGTLTAGNVGSPDRLEYSVIGETVNLASRLESLTKALHSDIVISPSTWELVREHFATRALGESEVRGFDGKIMLYGVTSHKAVGVNV